MMRIVRLFSIAALGTALVGCANYATLQDPETVPKNEFQLGVGGTFTRYSLEVETTTIDSSNGTTTRTTETSTESFTVPALTLSGRYGASDRLEIHGIAWLPLGASLGLKYMVAGDRKEGGFAFSPGLDVSVPITVSVNDESSTLVDFYLPMQTGYRVSPAFAAYLTPKYILRFFDGELHHVGGGTLGIALGEKTQFLLEGGALYDTTVSDVILSGALGFAFM